AKSRSRGVNRVPKAVAQRTLTLTVPVRTLGIDANFELTTQAMCAYRNLNVYPYLTSKGLAVETCQGSLAVRSQVSSKALTAGVVYITGSGHGDAFTFQGYLYEAVYQSGDYPAAEVKGKIVHLFACFLGRDLGRDFCAKECVAFFGY